MNRTHECWRQPDPPAPAGGNLRLIVIMILLLVNGRSIASYATSLPAVGETAPGLELPALGGEGTVRLADLRGRVVLLLFGELYNENSIAACRDIGTNLATAGTGASAYLVVTQRSPSAELQSEARRKGVEIPILHDPDRRALADYRVIVLPSLVVVDANGAVILSCAGYPLNFRDMVGDALLYAAGQLSAGEFDRRRGGLSQATTPKRSTRAQRLAALGVQLARRGSLELAVDTFRQAITADDECVSARIGLGTCLLNRGEPAAAEAEFRRALEIAPDSTESALGLIRVQIHRGGDELAAAATRLQELRQRIPHDPRVLYFTGLVAEKAGDSETALGSYRRAAELLLYGQQQGRE